MMSAYLDWIRTHRRCWRWLCIKRILEKVASGCGCSLKKLKVQLIGMNNRIREVCSLGYRSHFLRRRCFCSWFASHYAWHYYARKFFVRSSGHSEKADWISTAEYARMNFRSDSRFLFVLFCNYRLTFVLLSSFTAHVAHNFHLAVISKCHFCHQLAILCSK